MSFLKKLALLAVVVLPAACAAPPPVRLPDMTFTDRPRFLLDVAQISDICGIESADTFVRPIYAGNVLATVQSKDKIKVITVRITAFDPAAGAGSAATENVAAVADSGLPVDCTGGVPTTNYAFKVVPGRVTIACRLAITRPLLESPRRRGHPHRRGQPRLPLLPGQRPQQPCARGCAGVHRRACDGDGARRRCAA